MENQDLDKDTGLDQVGATSPSKSQLAKIKERFGKLTDQLRRTTMILKKREKSYYELEEKYASMEREIELEREKNQRFEQQFKDSMEGTLDVEALKNVTVLNAQIATLKKELSDTQAKMGKLKIDTAAKIKALQEGLQEEMGKAAQAKTDVEAQLAQLQEERVRYSTYQQDFEQMTTELKVKTEMISRQEAELDERQKIILQKEEELKAHEARFAEHLQEDQALAQKVEEERQILTTELQRLDMISRVFDVIHLEESILELRSKVDKSVRHPEQRELKIMLEEVELMKTRIDAFEKMTADRVSNYFNATFEMESMLKNKILLEA